MLVTQAEVIKFTPRNVSGLRDAEEATCGEKEPALNKAMILKNAWEGLKLTWDEWHMIVSGWGDGAGLNKAERIPMGPATTDFYSILAREAWYYKFGLALGRLTWILIIGKLLERLMWTF